MRVFNTAYCRSKTKNPKSLLSGAVAATLICSVSSSPAVFAQSSTNLEDLVILEELVVTARKREELIQDVPVAITALDAEAIERGHVSTVAEFDKLVPNVEFSDISFAGQALGATIRGIGFGGVEKSAEPAVGFSIDGVFLASNGGAAIDAFDLEKMEVLRGPQGTLFGRNTVGGVINVTRTRPTEESGAKIGTRLTSNGGTELMLVANTGQVGDVLSTKLYVFDKEDETFAKNVATGQLDDQTDSTSYGAAFLYEPNDRLRALVSIDAFDDDSQGPPGYNLTQPGELFCDLPNVFVSIGVYTPGSLDAGCASRSLDVGVDSDFSLYTRETPFINHLDGSSVTANIQYEVSDTLTLTSITGYRQTDEQLLEEPFSGPSARIAVAPGVEVGIPLLYSNRITETSQLSQELRLSGTLNDNLTFVSGIFYMQTEFDLRGGTYPDGQFGFGQTFGAVDADSVYEQETTAFAVFADGTYQINDKLSLSGGLRFSYEEKEASKRFILSGVEGVTGTSTTLSDDWSNPTGRLILQYELGDDAMMYGGYSRGFRSGGFNAAGGSVTAIGPYDEETVDSIEAGIRAEFFDNRLRVNPTVFYTEYSDKQEEITGAVPGGGPGDIETAVENASAVELKGFELELLAQVTPGLTLRGAFGVLDAEFTEFLVPDLTDPTGSTFIDESEIRNLRSGPDATASLGANYVRSMGDNGQLSFNAAYYWQDDIVTSASADPLGLGRDTVDGNEGFDFSLKYETLHSEGTNFSITAFINDAFDDADGRISTQIVVPGVLTFGVASPTKVYGIEANVEF